MRNRRTNSLLKSKIKNLKTLKTIVNNFRAKGKTIVFTNGCFDLLHYGHIKYLQEAKGKGDILIVAINSDASVKRIKGSKRPLINEKDRLRQIAALECVDYAVLFKEDTPLGLIKSIRPDILVKGSDWDKNRIVGSDIVLSCGGKVLTVKLAQGRSTTNLIKKIARLF